MALQFTGVGGLFTRLGSILKVAYLLDQYQASLVPAFTAIGNQYLSTLVPVGSSVNIQSSALISQSSGVMSFADNSNTSSAAWATVLQMVLADQPSQTWTQQAAMQEVIRQMLLQSATVQSNLITSTATALPTNVGNGIIVLSTLGGNGLALENTIQENTRVLCTSDSYTGSATQGQEQFNLNGAPNSTLTVWDYNYPTGSNAGVTANAISPSQNATLTGNLTTNGNFQTWTGSPSALSNWTLGGASVWGTDLQQNTSNPYSGSFDLQFNAGTGVVSQLYQVFNSSTGSNVALPALSTVVVNLPLRSQGAVAGGPLIVELVDSTGTVINDHQGVPNTFSINLTTLTNSFVFYSNVFRLPTNPPAVIWLRLRLSTAITNAAFNVGAVALAAPTAMYQGGPSFVIFSGTTPFQSGDGWMINNTNNQGGASYLATFQSGANRLFSMTSMGLLLPSSSSPSIPNTLITS